MDLAEFLLARIAEDAEVAEVTRAMERITGEPTRNMFAAPTRVLAECEAKWGLIRDATDVPTISMRRALRWLALPYANHPDYHVEWRPGPIA